MKLKQPRCHYSAEFKLEAVQQVILHQQRVVDVVRALVLDPQRA
ncbi:transposase [Xenorhabdus koppenhoeferi]|uniref:Transposase n=1 Tax=Xenorhabdus koppenhoeferi TaxID=351659 RepID=A0A1I7H489_9GAMM|nr:transposase [Xenorhabdus koppenhoeferi]